MSKLSELLKEALTVPDNEEFRNIIKHLVVMNESLPTIEEEQSCQELAQDESQTLAQGVETNFSDKIQTADGVFVDENVDDKQDDKPNEEEDLKHLYSKLRCRLNYYNRLLRVGELTATQNAKYEATKAQLEELKPKINVKKVEPGRGRGGAAALSIDAPDNMDEVRAKRHEYYIKNRDRILQYSRKYQQDHREEINARAKERARVKREKIKEQANH